MKKIQQYLTEVIQELKKVTWPNKEELVGSTWVVIVFAFAMAAFIGLVDIILAYMMQLVQG
jgi:preprotein translocase subunit SecE